jgi:hypothetical protein
MTTGYAHPGYAASLSEFGRPRALPACGGWLLERGVPGTRDRDAMGSYPLFACEDWRHLGDDLRAIGRELVSVVLVADPFGDHDVALLESTFNAGVTGFKDHHVVDLAAGPLESIVSSHHRRNVRKARRVVSVERVADPSACVDEWKELYAALIRRHHISGISAFSRASFERQLATPGMVAFRARREGETLGMVLFYVRGSVAYYHLGAYADAGYELGAAFAIFWTALEQFASEVRFVSLGADAGLASDEGGLSRFKRGWANGTRRAFLCRHVGDADRYAELARAHQGATFFPAYRAGEIAPLPRAGQEQEIRDA